MSGIGQFEFDLDFYTDTSMSRISTEEDFKNIGETVFAGIKPAQSMAGIKFYVDSCKGTVFLFLKFRYISIFSAINTIFKLPMSLIDQLV